MKVAASPPMAAMTTTTMKIVNRDEILILKRHPSSKTDPEKWEVFLLGIVLYAGWIVLFLKKRHQLDYKYFEQAGRNRNVTYQLIGKG